MDMMIFMQILIALLLLVAVVWATTVYWQRVEYKKNQEFQKLKDAYLERLKEIVSCKKQIKHLSSRVDFLKDVQLEVLRQNEEISPRDSWAKRTDGEHDSGRKAYNRRNRRICGDFF